VFVVKIMCKLFAVRSESCVEYQTCPESYDDRARQNPAFVHFPTNSYAFFNPVMAAVQTARQSVGNEIFQAIERRTLLICWIPKVCEIL
jgi:hypothetical protein